MAGLSLALMQGLWPAVVALCATPTVLPEPLQTAETEFAIPYSVDGTRLAGSRVQLHVSTDRGASWHFYTDAAPGEGSFAFRAPHAGEFWFLVRLADAASRPVSDDPFLPELR